MRLVVVCLLVASVAHAQPRVRPFMPTPGMAVGGRVIATAFCSTRAVLLLHTGEVVAIDAASTIHPVGKAGPGLIVCDRKDRISVIMTRSIVTFDGTHTHTTAIPTTQIRHARALDDDTLGLVDSTGTVYRFDGKALTVAWKAKISVHREGTELDGTGDRILTMLASTLVVHDRNGTTRGPRGLRGVWLDGRSVLFVDGTGAIARWIVGPNDMVERVHQVPAGRRLMFARLTMHGAGSRVIVQQLDGPLLVLELDAAGKRRAAFAINRLPFGMRIAAGRAPFAVLAFGDRAIVVDLRASSAAIPHDRPLTLVSGVAFSPDGRKLAMLGGDRDILVATLDRSSVTRLVSTGTAFLHGPLRWTPDGTLLARAGGGQIRWNLDGTVETQSSRTHGFTPEGDPIVFARPNRLVIERRHARPSFPFDARFGLLEAHATDRYLAARSSKRVEVFDLADARRIFRTTDRKFVRNAVLVGDSPAVMYAGEDGTIYLATPNGETTLAKIDGFPHMVASADRQRVAIGAGNALQVWDASGKRVAQVLAGGRIVALAWSPDLRTLAIATDAGIELWTIPR